MRHQLANLLLSTTVVFIVLACSGTGRNTGKSSMGGTSASVGGDSSQSGTLTGGAPAGGADAGVSPLGGSAGSPSRTSPACGSLNPLKSGTFTATVAGTSRTWMLDVPEGYDTNLPYRLVFVWHPLGGTGRQVVDGGFNGLKSLANNTTVFATADGLSGSNAEVGGTGWWNANGGDTKLFQAMLDEINAGLCIDQQRIFSTGFSFGGMMSYTLPYEFSVFRAIAPCSGKTGVIPYDTKHTDPVAIMAFHGDSDGFVATALGKAFLDQYVTRNKCGSQTQPVSPAGCVQYQDCAVPTIWCLFAGGHTTWSEEPAAIWNFFAQF